MQRKLSCGYQQVVYSSATSASVSIAMLDIVMSLL